MQLRIAHFFRAFIAVGLLLGRLGFAEQAVIASRIVEAVDESRLTVLKGSTHPLARAQFDRGLAPPDLPMNRMLLVLKRSPEQETALQTLLDNQQDKKSASYHQWLTPEQFGSQFGPNDHDVQVVSSWLQSHGFQIGKLAKGRNIIEFSGTASQVQEALHTSIHKYVVNGEEHWANASDPSIPTALTPVVAGTLTLHNFVKQPMIHVSKQKISAKVVPQGEGKPPKVTFPGTPEVNALAPADFAKIYNIDPLYNAAPAINGSGKTVAVVGRSNLFGGGSDITDFNQAFGVQVTGSVTTVLDGPDPGDLGGGEEAEATLDVSWSSGLAPGAAVQFVVSASTDTTDGVDLSEVYIIDNNLGDVMTESFGTCEAAFEHDTAQVQFYSGLAEQAAAQGITYFVASGDSGSAGCDDPDTETSATGPLSVNVLSATPFNVAVGGTMFNEAGDQSKYWSSSTTTVETALSYIPEDVWNESCAVASCGSANANIFAGGGGVSIFSTKPSWQSGVTGIPSDGARDVPDVALTAAAGHDPYLLCLEGSCVPNSQNEIELALVGGTSASTPSFAAIMALVDQKTNARQGQANYVLYKLAHAEILSGCNASNTTTLPGSTCVFNDVTVGNNAVPGEISFGTADPQYSANVGYDLATGLGSVNAANLVNNWSSVTFNATTTTIVSVSPTAITHGQSVDVDLTVSSGSGTPTGDVSILANTGSAPQTGVGFFTLSGGAASQSVNSLPGGTYTLTARYAGDGTFAPSTSAASAPIIVTSEGSVTQFSAQTLTSSFAFIPFSSGQYGSFVYLKAQVAGQSGHGVPTGNVAFLDGANSLGTFALNSQGNTATPNFANAPNGGTPTGLFTLAPGSHSITASYGGDASFLASNSSPVNLTITQAPTTMTVTSAASTQGTTFTATVNTTSGGTPPSGTITFSANGTQIGNPVTVTAVPATTSQTGTLQGAQATAAINDTSLTNGTYTVKAIYSGDTNYVGSSATTSITQASSFTITAGTGNNPTVTIATPGASGTLKLTITGVDGYSGTINFSASSCSGLPTGASCSFTPAAVTGSGTTTLTVTTTAATQASRSGQRPGWWLASLGTGIAAMFFLGGSPKFRSKRSLFGVMFYLLLMTGIGCGGGGGSSQPPPNNSTPTGTSTVTISVTPTSGTQAKPFTFTLNVE